MSTVNPTNGVKVKKELKEYIYGSRGMDDIVSVTITPLIPQNNMENTNLVVLLFIINVIIIAFKIIWSIYFKYAYTYKEIAIDCFIFTITYILSWFVVNLYLYGDINNLVVKFIFGLLFLVVIPFLALSIRGKIYATLKYSMIYRNVTLYIGYYYVVLILSELLINWFMKILDIYR